MEALLTAKEMVERDRYLLDQQTAANDKLNEINARSKALEEERQALARFVRDLITERKELAKVYAERTGFDLRKASRHPTAAAVEQAHGALLAAMCEPARLPVTDPIVVARLTAYRDAMIAHLAFKASRPAAELDRDDAA